MRRPVKALSLFCSAAVLAGALTACGSDAASGVTEASSEAAPSATDVLTVQVESIEESTVTAVVGELAQGQADGTPPDMPEGEAPPEAPSGEMPQEEDGPDASGTPPDAPSGEDGVGGGAPGGGMEFAAGDESVSFDITDATAVTVEFLEGSGAGTAGDIVVGAVLEVTLDENGGAATVLVKNLSAGGGFGGSGEVTQGTSANTLDADGTHTGETYTSTGDDENALRVVGATVTLDDCTVEKPGGESSNTEDGDFYGQNAALLVTDGATATITGATVTTDAVNGNGVFSYGEGTTVNVSDSTIRTTQNNSGGIQTTGGATMNAANLDVETQGASAAAIRSDRGGGTVAVEGGRYTTTGTGSPAVYCTADITVAGATLAAQNSEAIVVEGKNRVALNDCETTGNMVGTYSEDENQHIQNIMIYQSMSGDAEVGHAVFSATGGSITAQSGDMFYVTNTSCDIALEGVALTLANDMLMSVEGNDSGRGWGTAGANGGDVTFTARAQTLEGSIYVDEISALAMTLSEGSVFTGAINADGQEGEVTLTLDTASTWTMTGDSYLTAFEGDLSSVDTGGFTLYVGGEAQA